MKSQKTNATARALVYAVTFINLRSADDDESDDDVGALESIAAIIANCNESELDQLSHAAKDAYNEERRSANPREEFLEDYGTWMESICGEDWEGNDRRLDWYVLSLMGHFYCFHDTNKRRTIHCTEVADRWLSILSDFKCGHSVNGAVRAERTATQA